MAAEEESKEEDDTLRSFNINPLESSHQATRSTLHHDERMIGDDMEDRLQESEIVDNSLRATEEAFRRGIKFEASRSAQQTMTSAFGVPAKTESSSPDSLFDGIIGQVKSTNSPLINYTRGESLYKLTLSNDSDARKYKLFFVPSVVNELKSYCFKMIGEGTTACIKRNCTQLHRGAKMLMPLSGEAYVMKTKDRIFVEPQANVNFVDSELVEEWSSSRKSLKDWVELLQATTTNVTEEKAKAGLVINHQDIINTQDETNVNLSRKKHQKQIRKLR